MPAFKLKKRPLLVRVWRGYKAYRQVGVGRILSLKYSIEVHF